MNEYIQGGKLASSVLKRMPVEPKIVDSNPTQADDKHLKNYFVSNSK